MVAALNPPWNESITDDQVDARFEQASTLIGEQFLKSLDYYGNAWLPARDIVIKGLEQSRSLDPQGRILHLPQYCPFKVSALTFCLLTFAGTSVRSGARTRHRRTNTLYLIPG